MCTLHHVIRLLPLYFFGRSNCLKIANSFFICHLYYHMKSFLPFLNNKSAWTGNFKGVIYFKSSYLANELVFHMPFYSSTTIIMGLIAICIVKMGKSIVTLKSSRHGSLIGLQLQSEVKLSVQVANIKAKKNSPDQIMQLLRNFFMHLSKKIMQF